MDKFAHVHRSYPMSNGKYPSKEQPNNKKIAEGFRPTLFAPDGSIALGDAVEFKELNYIFSDMYEKNNDLDSKIRILEAK
ncbi:hypothetical protein [Yersinia pekkanenii]|uniref:Uncharacterized protein n=1 Tax=Yersinia pekkanenii TaxID=1288385 RepID=A0A0T9PBJ9_9GAMM|nr:hypothetical protein [Yersinia pekkanenii]CNH53498.1 Uncharacterised protein [Yersinia pekkanenii]CRY67551.1 Uncharacterised protein [Yersinia pekkanenii]